MLETVSKLYKTTREYFGMKGLNTDDFFKDHLLPLIKQDLEELFDQKLAMDDKDEEIEKEISLHVLVIKKLLNIKLPSLGRFLAFISALLGGSFDSEYSWPWNNDDDEYQNADKLEQYLADIFSNLTGSEVPMSLLDIPAILSTWEAIDSDMPNVYPWPHQFPYSSKKSLICTKKGCQDILECMAFLC